MKVFKRAERQPTGDLTIYAGIFCKVWTIADLGTLLPQHSHAFSHLSLIMSGAVQVWVDTKEIGVFRAPATIKIPAHTLHSFLTLTNGVTIACIHNEDRIGADGEPVVTEASRAAAEAWARKLED